MTEDKIYLRNVHADILIGINPEEREIKQPVIVNATLYTDCSLAAQSDNIEDAVDYSILHDEMVEHMDSTHYDLIETLAEKLAQLCLRDARVKRCTVSVDKPEALEFAESVAIEINRSQK